MAVITLRSSFAPPALTLPPLLLPELHTLPLPLPSLRTVSKPSESPIFLTVTPMSRSSQARAPHEPDGRSECSASRSSILGSSSLFSPVVVVVAATSACVDPLASTPSERSGRAVFIFSGEDDTGSSSTSLPSMLPALSRSHLSTIPLTLPFLIRSAMVRQRGEPCSDSDIERSRELDDDA
ncbi:hypothetical protein HETIRDRAFT_473759 [Heterobasidion irregulare TC 32-1]|uniref:Uncharacterized protein n=1 Tax=Heterobasidion irregulare (strain TC 32-1) TaxID=747525 RepID=W4KA14_HETIT|nr:uncharacterized protein HETIRDRAFT_473759 [Heterobasidion irregulare TC 32-1]ETW82618.1 hypothetical protein HETIRDRAFT_473759 [Heterobasidion irregulare TC 32-1]